MSVYNWKHTQFYESSSVDELIRIEDLVNSADENDAETVRELTRIYNEFWTADPQPLGCINCRKKIIKYFQKVTDLANE